MPHRKTIEIRHDANRWRAFMMVEWPAAKGSKKQRVISLRRGTVRVGTVTEFLNAFGPLELARSFQRDQEIRNVPYGAWQGLLAAWRKDCQAKGLVEVQMGVGVD
jgi:hypothetical protein